MILEMMRTQREVRSSGSSSAGGGGGSSSPSISCQDCGNKAKRDCAYLRCRTCCKSRGFHCPTHVRSTWVPVASRRRPKHPHHHHQLILPTAAADDPLPRRSHQIRNNPGASGMEGGNFPAQVNTMATFRCVRVSSDDNVVDQHAYQTSVCIEGHTFKGILYDHGPIVVGESSSSDQLQQLPAVTTTSPSDPPPSTAANLLYPSPPSLYSVPYNAIMPSMQFFPHPRP
ncbi:hypothetical protein Ancab_018062 [Ancistrocladus abbreviatus]